MASIELDWADCDTLATRALSALRAGRKHGLAVVMVSEVGPGTWPVMRFIGEREHICDLLQEYTGDDDEEAAALAATIDD